MTDRHPETTADPDEPGRRSSASAEGPPAPATAPGETTSGHATRSERLHAGRRTRQRAPSRFRWLLGPAIALLIIIIFRSCVAEPFAIPSASMQHTLEIGDRVLVQKFGGPEDLTRGDVIVFDGTKTFGALAAKEKSFPAKVMDGISSVLSLGRGTDYIKRIVGMPGDHVKCCTADGRLSVNDVPVTEPYLFPGDRPSDTPFDVTVPAGKLWVMGDHRSDSADSRSHMGAPGGGFIPEDDVIGKVWVRYWPLSRTGSLTPAPELARIPRTARTS